MVVKDGEDKWACYMNESGGSRHQLCLIIYASLIYKSCLTQAVIIESVRTDHGDM